MLTCTMQYAKRMNKRKDKEEGRGMRKGDLKQEEKLENPGR